jgi:acyl-CoA dehydrogenase
VLELDGKYQELQSRARALCAEAAEFVGEADESDTIHPHMRRLLAASGLVRLTVPGAYGGVSERVDPLAICVVREVLGGVSAHLDSLFAMQGIGSFALSTAGTETVRNRWLPAVAALDAIAALALTEPQVGSDLAGITTVIETRGDQLRVSGRKSFITNAGEADFYCVLGREPDGLSLVLVPAAAHGVSWSRPHQIIAPHVLGDVEIDGVEVPQENRIGRAGKGMSQVLSTLATFRVSVAGAAVGLAQAALDEAVRHCDARESFGVRMSRLGSIPHELARAWIDIEMARTFAYRAAAAAGSDPLASLSLSSMAKVGATETAGRVVDRAVQVMGRFGLIRGSTIERLYREARPMRIYEGSTEVILDSLSKVLVKQART